ncbi:MAG TPA: DUF3617 family protein [Burkholderiaceae bacterium]|nr:DUF3617 family protein [Burkholderiaceae bacterium]
MNRAMLFVLSGSLAGAAWAAELPKRAPGLWEEQFSSSAAPGLSTTRTCVDEKLTNFLMTMGKCSTEEVRRDGARYVVEAVCKQGDATIRTRTVVTGDLRQAYTAEMTTTQEPASANAEQSRVVVKGRHLGPCPSGMRGGDMIAPDGSRMNFYDLDKKGPGN